MQTRVMLGKYNVKYSELKLLEVCLIPSLHPSRYIIFTLLLELSKNKI